ncbi:MAG: oligoendopeptidase F, partial [Chloroflexia bacterium]|nr:oligoendopeptidase F [Chloroflexia bacterium]
MVAQQERSVPARQDVPLEETWAIEQVFATSQAWESALAAAEARLPRFDQYRGRLGESAATLLAALQLRDDVVQAVDLVVTVAMMRRSEDANDTTLQAMADRGLGLYTRANAAAAFYEPEIAAIPDATLTEWLQGESGLGRFRHAIERIQDRKAHIRSTEVEETLARAYEVTSSLDAIRDILEDGELPLGTIHDASGAGV